MKSILKALMVMVVFFVLTTSLLAVDRRSAIFHGFDNSISETLQLFIEKQLVLH